MTKNKRKTIRFLSEVNQGSSHALISTVENLLNQGENKIRLLLSSPGGSVYHGLSIYNFLKGVPIELETFNFGNIDSIALMIYCAGEKRYCSPNSRFLIHGINQNFYEKVSLEEKKLKELIQALSKDRENISKIIAKNCNLSEEEIEQIMLEGKTYNAQEAKGIGLVGKITEKILEDGEVVVGIG